MQVCTSLQTDNHASTPPLSFLQARCSSCRPAISIKALKALLTLISVLSLSLNFFSAAQRAKVCRYNWHSAGTLGWPFLAVKYF